MSNTSHSRAWIPAIAGMTVFIVLGVTMSFAHAAEASADARFKAIYTKEWAWRKEQFAIHDEENKREPLPDYLPSATPAAEAARLAYWTNVLKEVDAIPRSQLSPKAQVDHDVYRPQIAALVASERFRDRKSVV